MRYIAKISIFIITMLALAGIANGQTVLSTGSANQLTYQKGGYGADSVFVIPVRDTTSDPFPSYRLKGRVTIRPQDGKLYYHNGTKWGQVTGTGGGGITYDAGWAVIIRNDSIIVDSSKVATQSDLTHVSDTVATYIASLLTNYYTKTQSDARYLQSEVDGSVTNELQTLSLPDSQHIAISNGNTISVPWLSSYTETDPTVDGKITDAFNTLGIPLYRVTATGDSTADSIILKNGYRVPIPSGFYSSVRSAYNMNGLSDSVRLMFGVARPTFSGAGNLTVSWSLLGTTDGHTSLHIDSVKGIGPTLYIYFPTVKYMGFALAKVDDDLADIVHAQVGCRGNLNDIEVRGSVPGGTRQGYFIMPAGALTTYGLDFVNIDTSVTASGYSFKITIPAADNTNRYVPNGNYAGSNTARISAYYAGANSYHIHKIDDKWNPTFVILDMFGNTVPLKALDANDKIIVDTGMPFTFVLTWDYNNNGFFATTSAIWIAAWVKI